MVDASNAYFPKTQHKLEALNARRNTTSNQYQHHITSPAISMKRVSFCQCQLIKKKTYGMLRLRFPIPPNLGQKPPITEKASILY